jgi:ABC-type transport system substrate-binding protein
MNRRYGILILAVTALVLSWGHGVSAQTKPSGEIVWFAEQWDPKSVWADKRVRLAVNYALNRQAVSEAACLTTARNIRLKGQ